jgi:hypothetical protein
MIHRMKSIFRSSGFVRVLGVVVGAALLTSLGLGWLSYDYGSITAGLARLRGEQLVLVPATLDAGAGAPNERRQCRLQIVNLSNRHVNILGAQSTCGCVVVEDQLPFRLAAGESKEISITVTFVGPQTELLQSVTVYSDLSGAVSATAVVKAHIIGRSDSVK